MAQMVEIAGMQQEAAADYGIHRRILQATAALCVAAALASAHGERAAAAESSPATVLDGSTNGFKGEGTPMANKPSGYPTGVTAEEGDQAHVIQASRRARLGLRGGWAYVALRPKDSWKPWSCGWLPAESLSDIKKSPDNAATAECSKRIAELKLRSSLGSDFNGFGFVDGSPATLTEACDHQFYKSYFANTKSFNNVFGNSVQMKFAHNVGSEYGKVYYRYKLDSQAIVVRSDNHGWGVMRANCVDTSALEPSGAKKHPKTVPGANPNAKVSDTSRALAVQALVKLQRKNVLF